jgi:hypothetical protein
MLEKSAIDHVYSPVSHTHSYPVDDDGYPDIAVA